MIILDFDGTIVDVWSRYYSVFKDLLGVKELDFEEYRVVKRKVHKDSLVAQHFNLLLPPEYFKQKAVLLETTKYLEKDQLLFDSHFINEVLSKDGIILTKRRYPETFMKQIERLRIKGNSVVIESGNKMDWIEHNLPPYEKALMVGDSLTDLESVQCLNVEAWMVGYGLFTKEDFEQSGFPFKYYESPIQLHQSLLRRIEENAIQRPTQTIRGTEG